MKRLMIILATLSLTGCVLSVYPLYTEKQVVSDPALVGSWQEPDGDDDNRWTFSGGEKGRYEVTIDGDPFTGVLLELNRVRFLDLFPGERTKEQSDWFEMHFVRAHMFFRVQVKGDNLELAMIDPNALETLLDENPKAVAHKSDHIDDGPGMLTAETAELQAFITAHPELFDSEPMVMKRIGNRESEAADGQQAP